MCKMPEKTALIAMSGGVDSSVAALLMKQEGFECTGCTMKLFGGDGRDGKCGQPAGNGGYRHRNGKCRGTGERKRNGNDP